MKLSPLEGLTDEQILKEFIKRFNCNGAALVYFEKDTEFGFGAWNDKIGRMWVNGLFKRVRQEVKLRPNIQHDEPGMRIYQKRKKSDRV